MRRYGWLLAALALLALWTWRQHAPAPSVAYPHAPAPSASPASAQLPPEALQTLQRIAQGGPFPHRQDGAMFQNREHRLPEQPRGYYREYTVETPGAADRGARRIISGGQPPVEYFYSDDHYRSFRRIAANGAPR